MPRAPTGTSTRPCQRAAASAGTQNTAAALCVGELVVKDLRMLDVGSTPEDCHVGVRRTLEGAFGGALSGLKVAEAEEADASCEIELEVDPATLPDDDAAASGQENAAGILIKALASFGGRKTVELKAADGCGAVDFRYLPVSPKSCCWDYARLGTCPRLSAGRVCRWPHVRAIHFRFAITLRERMVQHAPPRRSRNARAGGPAPVRHAGATMPSGFPSRAHHGVAQSPTVLPVVCLVDSSSRPLRAGAAAAPWDESPLTKSPLSAGSRWADVFADSDGEAPRSASPVPLTPRWED